MKTFGCIFRKGTPKGTKNHYVSQSFLMPFRDIAKVNFSLAKTVSQKIKKAVAKT